MNITHFSEFIINRNELFILISFSPNYNTSALDEGWCKYLEVYNKILGLTNDMMNGGSLSYKVNLKVKKLKRHGFAFVYIKFD